MKIKYNIWDEIETLYWEKWFLHSVSIQSNDVLYELWFWGKEYAQFNEWQLKPDLSKDAGFTVSLAMD